MEQSLGKDPLNSSSGSQKLQPLSSWAWDAFIPCFPFHSSLSWPLSALKKLRMKELVEQILKPRDTPLLAPNASRIKEFSLSHCAQATGIPWVCAVPSVTDYEGTESQRVDTQRKNTKRFRVKRKRQKRKETEIGIETEIEMGLRGREGQIQRQRKEKQKESQGGREKEDTDNPRARGSNSSPKGWAGGSSSIWRRELGPSLQLRPDFLFQVSSTEGH